MCVMDSLEKEETYEVCFCHFAFMKSLNSHRLWRKCVAFSFVEAGGGGGVPAAAAPVFSLVSCSGPRDARIFRLSSKHLKREGDRMRFAGMQFRHLSIDACRILKTLTIQACAVRYGLH